MAFFFLLLLKPRTPLRALVGLPVWKTAESVLLLKRDCYVSFEFANDMALMYKIVSSVVSNDSKM